MTLIFSVNNNLLRDLEKRELKREAAREAANQSLRDSSDMELEKIIGSTRAHMRSMSPRLPPYSTNYLVSTSKLPHPVSVGSPITLNASAIGGNQMVFSSQPRSQTLTPLYATSSSFPPGVYVTGTSLSSPTSFSMLPPLPNYNPRTRLSFLPNTSIAFSKNSVIASPTPSDLTIRPSYGPPVSSPFITGQIGMRPLSSRISFLTEASYAPPNYPSQTFKPSTTQMSPIPQFHYLPKKDQSDVGKEIPVQQVQNMNKETVSSAPVPSPTNTNSQIRLDNTSLGLPDVTIVAFPQTGGGGIANSSAVPVSVPTSVVATTSSSASNDTGAAQSSTLPPSSTSS